MGRRIVVAALSLTALLAFGHVARQIASRIGSPLDFDVGPSTGPYLDGFTESEERLPVTFRWTRERASIALPLEGASSEARLKLRLARFLPGSARVRVFVDGAPAGAFSARSGRFRTVDRPIVACGARVAPRVSFGALSVRREGRDLGCISHRVSSAHDEPRSLRAVADTRGTCARYSCHLFRRSDDPTARQWARARALRRLRFGFFSRLCFEPHQLEPVDLVSRRF